MNLPSVVEHDVKRRVRGERHALEVRRLGLVARKEGEPRPVGAPLLTPFGAVELTPPGRLSQSSDV